MAGTDAQIDIILSTLNAADIGSLDSIAAKMTQARQALHDLGQPELAGRAGEAVAALTRGDVPEFKRLRAFLQAKVGHLR
jgi:hypothetical protein